MPTTAQQQQSNNHDSPIDWLDALERSLEEVEALRVIYEDTIQEQSQQHPAIACVAPSSQMQSTLQEAQSLVDNPKDILNPFEEIPSLQVMIRFHVQAQEDQEEQHEHPSSSTSTSYPASSTTATVLICFTLPPGYPTHQSATLAIYESTIPRAFQESLRQHVQQQAQSLIGSEALLECIQSCHEYLLDEWNRRQEQQSENQPNTKDDDQNVTGVESNNEKDDNRLSRRWIWVHHITDVQRQRDIVAQAHEHELGGYLKAGYPGIVVLEGTVAQCDAFGAWIKGNKSRPGGGFGRQWGHHVRGELIIDHRQLPTPFAPIESHDMSDLSANCRHAGVLDEFRQFVLQHPG